MRWKNLMIAAMGGCVMACGAQTNAKASAEVISASFSASSLHQAYLGIATNADFQSGLRAILGKSFSTVGKALAPPSDSSAFAIDGATFTKSLAMDTKSMQAYDRKYASIGAYWRELNIDPTAAVTGEQFSSGLAALAKFQTWNEGNSGIHLSVADLQNAERARLVAVAFAGTQNASRLSLTIVLAGKSAAGQTGTCTTNAADSLTGTNGILNVHGWSSGGGISGASWQTSDYNFINCAEALVAGWPNTVWAPDGTAYPLDRAMPKGDSASATKLADQGGADLYNITIGDAVRSQCLDAQNNNQTCYNNMKYNGFSPASNTAGGGIQ